MGNHEFYNHSIPDLIKALKREAKGSNVHVLENNAFTINDFVFLGCSLWTNFRLWPDTREAMSFADQEMSDFSLIQKKAGNGLFCAKDSAKIHAASVRWLGRQMSRHDPARTIVVTHHAPSSRSIPPEHSGDKLTAAFASDLDSLIAPAVSPFGFTAIRITTWTIKSGRREFTAISAVIPTRWLRCFEPGNNNRAFVSQKELDFSHEN
jgi:hypothetical protein